MTDDATPSKCLLVDFIIDHVKHFGFFPTEYEDETGTVHYWDSFHKDSYWNILTGENHEKH